jgi:hypothetical protein
MASTVSSGALGVVGGVENLLLQLGDGVLGGRHLVRILAPVVLELLQELVRLLLGLFPLVLQLLGRLLQLVVRLVEGLERLLEGRLQLIGDRRL